MLLVNLTASRRKGLKLIAIGSLQPIYGGCATRHEIESESERLIEIGQRIREKQELVKAETIKKKTLEWIKQTEYSKYLEWLNRAEQKTADELIGLRRKAVGSRR